MNPQRVLISRDGSDRDHREMHGVTALLPADPQVGEALQLWTDTGFMRTSAVKRVVRDGSELVIDTRNSRYRLKLLS